jgi:hypothetical protein
MTAPARTFEASTRTTARTATKTTAVDLDALARDFGLLALRLTAGLLMAGHGAQKLFGWWGGPNWDFIVNGFAQAGYRPGKFFAVLAASSEVVGGLFLALGRRRGRARAGESRARPGRGAHRPGSEGGVTETRKESELI